MYYSTVTFDVSDDKCPTKHEAPSSLPPVVNGLVQQESDWAGSAIC